MYGMFKNYCLRGYSLTCVSSRSTGLTQTIAKPASFCKRLFSKPGSLRLPDLVNNTRLLSLAVHQCDQ